MNTEFIHVNHSPVGYTAYPMPVGANGNIFHVNSTEFLRDFSG